MDEWDVEHCGMQYDDPEYDPLDYVNGYGEMEERL